VEGSAETSFPPLLHGRVCADFRESHQYFGRLLDLLLSLYRIPPQHPLAVELRSQTEEP
jgi:hypothetical protein